MRDTMSTPNNPVGVPPEDEFMSLAEIAVMFRVTQGHVYRMTEGLQAYKRGRERVFRRDEILALQVRPVPIPIKPRRRTA